MVTVMPVVNMMAMVVHMLVQSQVRPIDDSIHLLLGGLQEKQA